MIAKEKTVLVKGAEIEDSNGRRYSQEKSPKTGIPSVFLAKNRPRLFPGRQESYLIAQRQAPVPLYTGSSDL